MIAIDKNRTLRIASPATTSTIMLDVIVALMPALLMAVYFFGLRVLALTAVSVMSCVGFEYLYQKLTHQKITVRDLSACVTGVLIAMCLPSTAPYWAPLLGSFFAIVVVKQFYGGLGHNFMNPALAGRMLLCTFPMLMTTWVDAKHRLPVFGTIDVVSTATPMAYLHNGELPNISMGELLIGNHGGSIGEVSSVMLIMGGIYLLLRQVIRARIPLTFIGTVAILTFLFPQGNPPLEWMVAQILSGGLLLGAIFMATDCITSPITVRGQMIYGVCCGALTVLLRYYGAYPDGVGWAILTMNCSVWILDRVGMPRRFGERHFMDARRFMARLQADMAQIRFQVPKMIKSPFEKGKMPGEAYLDELHKFGKSAVALGGVIIATSIMVVLVNQTTEFDAKQIIELENQALMAQVMPEADFVTEAPYNTPSAMAVSAGYKENTLIGHTVTIQVAGFGGPLTMMVGVDVDGRVTGVAVLDHHETTDMGTGALEQDYLTGFIGQSGTITIGGVGGVDVVSGATATSKAVTEGINRALSVVAHLEEEGVVDYVDGEV